MKVSLIRHTSVVEDGNYTCYGSTDVAVSENFSTEAEALKQSVLHLRPEAVFSSPLSRARMLADYVGFTPVVDDDRLKELDFGILEMQPWCEILKNKDEEAFFDYHISHPFPGGESLLDQQSRVQAFFDEKKALGFKYIMVFCHGGVINCVRSIISDLPLRDAFFQLAPFATHIPLEY